MKRVAQLAQVAQTVFAVCVLLTSKSAAQDMPPTASQLIDRIKANVGVPWTTPTVDTIKAGDANTPVTGIAVTMMATLDVLERAAASGNNLIVTHEPTFYNHLDKTSDLESPKRCSACRQTSNSCKEHHLVVWRFHDHWHARKPDGILLGMTHALGWEKFQNPNHEHLFVIPETTLDALAATIKQKLNIRVPLRGGRSATEGHEKLRCYRARPVPPDKFRLLERDGRPGLADRRNAGMGNSGICRRCGHRAQAKGADHSGAHPFRASRHGRCALDG